MNPKTKQMVVDISGRLGLADRAHGDEDAVMYATNRLYGEKDGEMAHGRFNPYFRKGYLAPTIRTATTVTVSPSAATRLTSLQYDSTNKKVFFADRSNSVHLLASLNATTISRPFQILSGSTIHDLEMYELNRSRNLYVTYVTSDVLMVDESTSMADMTAIGFVVNPVGTTQPVLIDKAHSKVKGVTQTYTIAGGTGGNNAALLCFVTSGTPTTVTMGGIAMTQVGSVISFYHRGELLNFYAYRFANPSSVTIVITCTSDIYYSEYALFSNTDTTNPFINVENSNSAGRNVLNLVTQVANANYYQFTFGTAAMATYNSSIVQTFDQSAQTVTGTAILVDNTGTMMYISGGAGNNTIYRYTLGSAYDISSAVFTSSTAQVSQPDDTIIAMRFRPDGLRRFVLKSPNNLDITIYSIIPLLAWDTLNTSVAGTLVLPATNYGEAWGFDITEDGLDMYIGVRVANMDKEGHRILHYKMGTAWVLSTAVFSEEFVLPPIEVGARGLFLGPNDATIVQSEYNGVTGGAYMHVYSFDPMDKRNISKVQHSGYTSGPTASTVYLHSVNPVGTIYYGRDITNVRCRQYSVSTVGINPSFISQQSVVNNNSGTPYSAITSQAPNTPKLVDIDVANPVTAKLIQASWLAGAQNQIISSDSEYNFIRTADNGFAYLFTQNRVHKLDGTPLGGEDGLVSKNVLLFPNHHTIVDALDYRSKLFIAIHQYPTDSSVINNDTYPGSCGLYIWNRISTQLSKADYIDLPGVKEIKKIYASPDQVLKLIVVSENGLTEIREFGYNDSGGVVFRPKKILRQGAYPQFPDGLTTAGDKTVWLANDGTMYCERDGTVVELMRFNDMPTTTIADSTNNLLSGVIFYGAGSGTADANLRENKQAIIVGYSDPDGTIKTQRIAPIDSKTLVNASNQLDAGNVFTGVKYLPVTSELSSVRIYNLPTVTSNTDAIASVNLYFNQSSTIGMTKTITKKEAARGYVDLKVNKRYIHAVQIEIVWDETLFMTTDTYMPNIAVITYTEASTQSPDNE